MNTRLQAFVVSAGVLLAVPGTAFALSCRDDIYVRVCTQDDYGNKTDQVVVMNAGAIVSSRITLSDQGCGRNPGARFEATGDLAIITVYNTATGGSRSFGAGTTSDIGAPLDSARIEVKVTQNKSGVVASLTHTLHPINYCCPAPRCSDNISCTNDWCDFYNGCHFDDVDSWCDDGDGCTDDWCKKSQGCKHAYKYGSDYCRSGDIAGDVEADDGEIIGCNVKIGRCDANGQCLTEFRDCQDGDRCTDDRCDTSGGCTHTARTCVKNEYVDTLIGTDDRGRRGAIGCKVLTGACNSRLGCLSMTLDCRDGNDCSEDRCKFSDGPNDDVVAGCKHDCYFWMPDMGWVWPCSGCDTCIHDAKCESGCRCSDDTSCN